MAPQNRAAYTIKPKSGPFQIKDAPYTPPKAGQLVVKTHALAINPVDALLPEFGGVIMTFIKYPTILGNDVAGEVVEIGEGVKRFQPGDRALGHAVGGDPERNTSIEGAFQHYVVLLEDMTSPISDGMSYERACVIPLGCSTAAVGLFQDDQLALRLPIALSHEKTTGETLRTTGETLLIWGGSTSVGSNAIQLAVAAGYTVITTCSPRNFAYCKDLGASQTFDYNSKTIVPDITAALKGKKVVGAMAIGNRSTEACLAILSHTPGARKFISQVSPTTPEPMPKKVTAMAMLRLAAHAIPNSIALFIKTRLSGVGYKFVFGSSLVHNGVGKAIYADFLPQALAKGRYVPKPDPEVFGNGLESVQGACEHLLISNPSAKKIVVTLG